MNTIGIVNNPNARGNLRDPGLGDDLKSMLGPKDGFFQTRHVEGLPDLMEQILDKNMAVLGINGGDGTIHAVLTALVKVSGNRRLPRILILRGGTMNTVANALKHSGTPRSILKNWIQSRHLGRYRVIRQPTLRVNGNIGFMTGAGVVTRFLDEYYRDGWTGPLKVLTMIGALVPGALFGSHWAKAMFSPAPMTVSHEGTDLGENLYTAVLAATVPEVGLGFRLTYRCSEKPDSFHLAAVNVTVKSLVPRLYHLWAGKDPSHPGFLHHGPSKMARIEHDGPLRWIMDGEIYETSEPLDITPGPVVEVITL